MDRPIAVGIGGMNKKERNAEEARWKAEDDMRTLLRAKRIRKDDKRMAAVAKMAKEKLTDLASLAGKE